MKEVGVVDDEPPTLSSTKLRGVLVVFVITRKLDRTRT